VRKLLIAALLLVLVLGLTGSSFARIGLGIGSRYHVALKDIQGTDFDDSHLSFLAGLRLKVIWLILDGDVDYRPGGGDITYSLTPKISFLVDILGTGFYAGVGIEKTYVKWALEEAEWSKLTYVLQAGREIGLGPLSLILDAYYEQPTLSLKDIEAGFITFGARLFWYF
jgi:hypothetical protein